MVNAYILHIRYNYRDYKTGGIIKMSLDTNYKLKAFINYKDRVVGYAAIPTDNWDKVELDIKLDLETKHQIMQVLGIHKGDKLSYKDVEGITGNIKDIINAISIREPGLKVVGFRSIYLGESYITDQNTLKIIVY